MAARDPQSFVKLGTSEPREGAEISSARIYYVCTRCGHETSGRRKVRPDLCGPCLLGKRIGWWDGFEEDARRAWKARA